MKLICLTGGTSPTIALRAIRQPLYRRPDGRIFCERMLWKRIAAATIVAVLPQLLLSLMVQQYIVRSLTMGAVT